MDHCKVIGLHLPLHSISVLDRPTVLVGFASAFLFLPAFRTVNYSRKQSKEREGIPGPSGWPFNRSGLTLSARPRELLNSWTAQFGDAFKVRVRWYNWMFFNNDIQLSLGTILEGVKLKKLSDAAMDELAHLVSQRKVVSLPDRDLIDDGPGAQENFMRYLGKLNYQPVSGIVKDHRGSTSSTVMEIRMR
ncbi:hypothetical protein CNMCM6936_005809 [Aspergillus lentulus]|nr:hypothetical protein CNMCM6936_005809 [Aspergillus lentulus]